MHKRHRCPWAGVCAAAVLLSNGLHAQDVGDGRRSVYGDLQMFSQVLNQIRVNHPDSIDPHDLFMAAVEGMVRAADPHSYVLPAANLSPQRREAIESGRLHPVPIQFVYVDDVPVVASVNPGSAASSLDLFPGDELVAIDGESVTANSSAELDLVLSGEEGTGVVLTLERRRLNGSVARIERTVMREETGEEIAVVAQLMLDDSTGYVRVSHFASEDVADDFHDALGHLKEQGMTQLVLDLRDNAGGLVEQAAEVAGEFLPRGVVVYTAEGRKEEVADTVKVGRSFWKREDRYPVVVLVNEGTASAAELVAGALQDHDRAIIVGRPTFGKSLLMRRFPLTDGSVIVLVVGHLKTPCGRVVQRRYRGVSRRDYLRAAGSVQDTVGRPSCLTASGRTVYGGGGIYPDVVLPEPDPEPVWMSEIRERQLVLRWLGGFVEGADSLELETGVSMVAVTNLVRFARAEGIEVPSAPAAEDLLKGLIAAHLAWHLGGQVEYYSTVAPRSRWVAAAAAALPRARAITAR